MTTMNLTNLRKAIESLDALLVRVSDPELMSGLDNVTRLGLKAGVVKNFEFAYELCWKAMKRWLEENVNNESVDGVTRRELFRLSAENKLIAEVEMWMDFHNARNETSHTYDEETAESVFQVTKAFLPEARNLLAALEARND